MSLGLHVEAEVRRGVFHLLAACEVPPGLSVLFGPSGAGKSMTLQAIAGLLPLAAGRILLDGRPLADVAARVWLPPAARRIGYVPQSSALFPHLSVAQNVAYALPGGGPLARGKARAAREARVAELLALVRLPGYERRVPGSLSGGEAQRVALARALAAEPAALLLDEPLSALDAPTRTALQEDLRAVVLQCGVPALVVTHDLAEARALGDRLVVLVGGQVVAQGALAAVLAAPPTAEAARLLGWRNLLAVARVEARAAGMDVILRGGQVLTLPTTAASAGAAGSVALALRADRLEALAPQSADAGSAPSGSAEAGGAGTLSGRVCAVAEMGAFYALAVALDGEPADAPPLTLTCSPREWAALGVGIGDALWVYVAPEAARLVEATPQRVEHPAREGDHAQ